MSRKLVATSAVFALAMLGFAGSHPPQPPWRATRSSLPPRSRRQSMPPNGRHGPGPARDLTRERPGQQEPPHHRRHSGRSDRRGRVPTGIRVGTGTISRDGPVPTCPPLAVEGFTLKGLTIKHGGFSGVFLVGSTAIA